VVIPSEVKDRLSATPDRLSSPAMQCIRVDLPDPDGPMIEVNSPVENPTVTPSRACTRVPSTSSVRRASSTRAAIVITCGRAASSVVSVMTDVLFAAARAVPCGRQATLIHRDGDGDDVGTVRNWTPLRKSGRAARFEDDGCTVGRGQWSVRDLLVGLPVFTVGLCHSRSDGTNPADHPAGEPGLAAPATSVDSHILAR
jgi:hypothetical protein